MCAGPEHRGLAEQPSPLGVASPCGNCPPLWELPSLVGGALPCGRGSPLWELPSPVGAAFTCGRGPPLWELPSPVGAPSSTWKSKLRHPKHTQTRGTGSAKVMDPPRSPLATQIPAWEAGPGLFPVPKLWVRATLESKAECHVSDTPLAQD